MSKGSSNATPCSNARAKASSRRPSASACDGRPSRPTAGERTTRRPATGSARSSRPAARRSRTGSAPISTTCFPTMPARPAPRANADRAACRPIRNGRATGGGGREDGDYNLEAFVSAELTLADHLAEQLALAIADPVRRMIGQYLIDLVDEAGYLSGDLAGVAEKLGAPLPRSKRCLRILQTLRSARRVRAQSHRMPRHPAQGAQPLRSGDAGAGRPSRSARQARSCGAAPHLRRRRRGPRRHDRGNPHAQSEAGPRLRLDRGAADRARRVRAPGPGRRLHRRAQLRHAAEGAGQPDLPRRSCRRTRRTDSDKTYLAENRCSPRPG